MSAVHSPLFERLTGLLDPLNPAELHGLLCGLLCSDADLQGDQWLHLARDVLADGAELSKSACDVLIKLLEYETMQLSDPDGPIALLLPNDDAPLNRRTDALGAWCQGLLYGLGLGQVERQGALSKESREFLRDAADIAQVGFENDESSEADEAAYAEVVEYLRAGLLLIYLDLRRTAAPDARLH